MVNVIKPSYRMVNWNINQSINTKVDSGINLSKSWHYHPELELILIKRSSGTRIIGTSVERFYDNDAVMIGKNLPHAFLHDDLSEPGSYLNPEAIVIQFYDSFLGKDFLNLPELKDIQKLFIKARQGLSLTGYGKDKIIPLMEEILRASSLDRILILLQILRIMQDKESYTVLSQEEKNEQLFTERNERINKIVSYTNENYGQNIKIEYVAKLVNLTKESFCRYFKACTNKTYFQFLTELRIQKACKLIIETSKSVKEVGYSCGYESLSNFHYQFKRITKSSPLEYKNLKEIRTL